MYYNRPSTLYISHKFTLAICMDRSAVTVYTCIKLEFIILFTEGACFLCFTTWQSETYYYSSIDKYRETKSLNFAMLI